VLFELCTSGQIKVGSFTWRGDISVADMLAQTQQIGFDAEACRSVARSLITSLTSPSTSSPDIRHRTMYSTTDCTCMLPPKPQGPKVLWKWHLEVEVQVLVMQGTFFERLQNEEWLPRGRNACWVLGVGCCLELILYSCRIRKV
jgi:hypothetical protein